jgi:polysaccharide pyruvyl transferase WcaK-like protein
VETFGELSEEMARAEVVVASRFHNLICALRVGRPTVSLGYATKNRRLMRSMGLQDYCQDIGDVDAARLLEQLRAARADAAALNARIAAVAARYAAEVNVMLDAVAARDLGLPSAEEARTR